VTIQQRACGSYPVEQASDNKPGPAKGGGLLEKGDGLLEGTRSAMVRSLVVAGAKSKALVWWRMMVCEEGAGLAWPAGNGLVWAS
jgi:hypothetical protein